MTPSHLSPLTDTQRDALIDIVRTAARDLILPRFRNLSAAMIGSKSAPDDLVTIADREAEAQITAAVQALLPGVVVIGEEAVSADPSQMAGLAGADLAVIIDPVDGTWNYANGLALFGVILAVVVRGQTVFGLLYDPLFDDWVAAVPGGGAWYHQPGRAAARLQVAAPKPVADSTGFVPLFLFPQPDRVMIAAGLPGFSRALSLRCSCHEYRLLAQGRAEFCLAHTLHPWDHAAGVLAHAEAGGYGALISGQPYSPVRTEGPLLTAPDRASWHAIRAQLGFSG